MDKIEISGFEYIGPELSFIVFENLWRESDEKGIHEIYIVMGKQEYKDSGGKLGIGKKVSLRNLLSLYSNAIRQGLVK